MPKAIPDGFSTLTPYLAFTDAKKAIEFYKTALGAELIYALPMPDGRLGHAELKIGTARMMLADENPAFGNKSAKTLGGSPIGLCIYTENVDALAERFRKAGGKEVRPVQNQFYGDRSGTFLDPEGYQWTLAQHVEDVSPEEMAQRMSKMGG